MLDTLNHGTLNLPNRPRGAPPNEMYYNKTTKKGGYTFMVGVAADPFDKSPGPRKIVELAGRGGGGVFDSRNNDTQIYFDASIRASRRVQHVLSDFDSILASLERLPPVPGKPLNTTPLFSMTFNWPDSAGSTGGCYWPNPDVRCALPIDDPVRAKTMPAKNQQFKRHYCLDELCMGGSGLSRGGRTCQNCRSPGNSGGTGLEVITLGDEISTLQWAILGQPPFPQCNNTGFQAYVQAANISLAALGCTNGLTECKLTNIGPPASNVPLSAAAALLPCGLPLANGCQLAPEEALMWYTSSMYVHNTGISNFKNQTHYWRTHTTLPNNTVVGPHPVWSKTPTPCGTTSCSCAAPLTSLCLSPWN